MTRGWNEAFFPRFREAAGEKYERGIGRHPFTTDGDPAEQARSGLGYRPAQRRRGRPCNHHAVHGETRGGPQHRTEIVRVVDSIQQQDATRFAGWTHDVCERGKGNRRRANCTPVVGDTARDAIEAGLEGLEHAQLVRGRGACHDFHPVESRREPEIVRPDPSRDAAPVGGDEIAFDDPTLLPEPIDGGQGK